MFSFVVYDIIITLIIFAKWNHFFVVVALYSSPHKRYDDTFAKGGIRTICILTTTHSCPLQCHDAKPNRSKRIFPLFIRSILFTDIAVIWCVKLIKTSSICPCMRLLHIFSAIYYLLTCFSSRPAIKKMGKPIWKMVRKRNDVDGKGKRKSKAASFRMHMTNNIYPAYRWHLLHHFGTSFLLFRQQFHYFLC